MDKKQTTVMQLISSLETGGAEKLLIEMLRQNNKMQSGTNFVTVIINKAYNENLRKDLMNCCENVYFLNRKEGQIDVKYLFQLLKIINSHNIKIIHSHNTGSKYWSILCKIFKPKLKLVYTLHNSKIIGKLNQLQLFIHRTFIDCTIAISKYIYQDTILKKINKTKLVYNGLDIEKYSKIAINQSYDDSLINIVNVGRIFPPHKAQDVLIKAIRICKDKGYSINCNFIGGTYSYAVDALDELKNLVKELNIENEISFQGDQKEVLHWLQNAGIFILPSREEGLPLTLIEAMSAGLPVIASNISGSNELITHNENGLLFESENPENLAENIIEMHENKELREKIISNSIDFIKGFEIAEMVKKYNKLYIETV